jgi:hypothetical protein
MHYNYLSEELELTVKKVKVTLYRPPRIQSGSRGIALLILNLGASRGWVVSLGHFSPGKDPVPIVQEAGWVPGPVWTYTKNLASTGIRFPDRPARSQSIYRLSYRAHTELTVRCIIPKF